MSKVVRVTLELEDGTKEHFNPGDSEYVVVAHRKAEEHPVHGLHVHSVACGRPTAVAEMVDTWLSQHPSVIHALARIAIQRVVGNQKDKSAVTAPAVPGKLFN